MARELIAKADVVVENFSGGVMKKYGLDYASVASTNPRLVYCSISAYGRKGPFALRPGFDPITQAESGFMSLNGFPDGQPVRTGPPIVDMATGMSACNAILLALLARDRLGRGQHVEVALIDIAVAMTGFYGMAYLITARIRAASAIHRTVLPASAFTRRPTDRSISPAPMTGCIAAWSPRCWSGPTSSPIRNSRRGRREPPTGKSCAPSSAGCFKADRLESWMAKMKKANVPVGYLRTVEQGFNAPEVRERHRLSRIPHPTAGSVPNIETPLRLELTPVVDPVAAPLLGEHTREVLRSTLGYDDARIATLAEAGAFGARPGNA